MSLTVREARKGDGEALHQLVRVLADHHGDVSKVVSTPELIEVGLCEPSDRHGCLVAELDGAVVGFAYWYEIFTTYTARNKMYLEDIAVAPEARGTGAGFALMRAVAKLCVERGCPRFEWLAMNTNAEGQKFYAQVGGKVLEGGQTWQMWGDDIAALAEG